MITFSEFTFKHIGVIIIPFERKEYDIRPC